MINIKPVSDLRNYNKLLSDVKANNPLFLTKNGRGKYAIINIEDYDKFKAGLELLNRLQKAQKGPFHKFDDVARNLDK